MVELAGPSRVVFKAGKEGFKIQMSRDELNEGFENFKIIQDSLEDENLEIQLIDLSFKDQVVIRETNQVQH